MAVWAWYSAIFAYKSKEKGDDKMKLLLIGLLLSSTANAQLNVPYSYQQSQQYQQQPDWTQQNRDRQEQQQRQLDERWRQEREYQQRERQIQQERQFINGLRRWK